MTEQVAARRGRRLARARLIPHQSHHGFVEHHPMQSTQARLPHRARRCERCPYSGGRRRAVTTRVVVAAAAVVDGAPLALTLRRPGFRGAGAAGSIAGRRRGDARHVRAAALRQRLEEGGGGGGRGGGGLVFKSDDFINSGSELIT